MAERDRLLSDCRGECLDRGFESPPPRQKEKNPVISRVHFSKLLLSFYHHIATGNDIHTSSKGVFQNNITHLDGCFQMNPPNF